MQARALPRFRTNIHTLLRHSEITITLLTLSITCGILLGCDPAPERLTFTTASKSPGMEWQRVLQQGRKVELTTLFTGTVTVPTSGMLDLSDPKTEAITEKSMVVEVYAHWIKHPVRGDYFVDSGLNKSYAKHPQGDIKGVIAPFIVKDSHQNPGENIGALIEKHNIELNGVFFTHAHMDHTSGIPELPKDIHYYIGGGEPLTNFLFILSTNYFNDVDTLIEFDFSRGHTIAPFQKVIDIFSDGSVWAIATPGHSPGHVSYLINATTGPVLLTGDASHTRWGFENNVIPGWANDVDAAKQSLASLRQMAAMYPEVTVIYGHEK